MELLIRYKSFCAAVEDEETPRGIWFGTAVFRLIKAEVVLGEMIGYPSEGVTGTRSLVLRSLVNVSGEKKLR